MDWRVLLTAFVTVFVAELGDKTQLAALGLAAGSRARLAVFIGASLALIATSAIAVLGADVIARWVSPLVLKRVSALLFIGLGIWTLWTSRSG
ncbi:MAG: TMEM165/GDT1 family protein [Deltaproteobacteria bacterium]|nr:TMEM165/GDT1 family protein [Deltaproteobacteria bacterium]